jgi:hypothetical protein
MTLATVALARSLLEVQLRDLFHAQAPAGPVANAAAEPRRATVRAAPLRTARHLRR